MARYKSVVLVNSKPGQDAAFNRFYEEQHLDDVLKVPGYVSVERFKLADAEGKWTYLTLYEIETDDLPAVQAEVRRRLGTELMPLDDTGDLSSLFTGTFAPISAKSKA